MRTPEVSYLTLDTGASSTVFPRSWAPNVRVFPTKSGKRGHVHSGAGAGKIIGEGGQVVTLDVDQVSREWMLRSMVTDVRNLRAHRANAKLTGHEK